MESTKVGHHDAWNKGKLVGQKAPFKLKEIWSIRVRLEMQGRLRELALFDLGIDSKLRACDLLNLRVRDVCHGDRVAARAIVLQQKTQRPVQFEITPPTREVLGAWIKQAGLKLDNYLFPSRVHHSPHLGTRQYARIVDDWVEEIGLDSTAYGTHSMRRTKPTLIYRLFLADGRNRSPIRAGMELPAKPAHMAESPIADIAWRNRLTRARVAIAAKHLSRKVPDLHSRCVIRRTGAIITSRLGAIPVQPGPSEINL